ncbi:GlxA family transcriptional regulator [Phyllobacterium sp. K27]
MAVFGLFEVLGSVGKIWPLLTGETTNVRSIKPKIVAQHAEGVMSAIGIPIVPHAAIGDNLHPDVVIVCDIELPLKGSPDGRWRKEISWISGQMERGAVICSTCSGSVLLAEAGLLDGKEATSHWSAAALFRDRYSAVKFRPERILCETNQNGTLITTGGASSWQDLALYLIGRFCGAEEAVRAAKIFVIGDRSEGQLPFAAMTRPRKHEDVAIADCQQWIAYHYAEPTPVTRMMQRSGLAERTFKRRFKMATGYTPVDYVQALRIEEARQMLETSNRGIDDIAAEVGYEDSSFFRRIFKRHAGLSPAQYRRRFCNSGLVHGEKFL